jgi:hypothetical protein
MVEGLFIEIGFEAQSIKGFLLKQWGMYLIFRQ